GFYLGLDRAHVRTGKALIAAGYLISLLCAAVIGVFTGCAPAALLCALPLTEVFGTLMRSAASMRVRPSFTARMDPDRLPACRRRTAIAVCAVLSRREDIGALERRFTTLYLSQRDCDPTVVLLGDLPPAEKAREKEDAALIESYRSLIDRLGDVGGRFVLAVRGRKFSPTQNGFIGRERKRGAILALTEFITCGTDEFLLLYGAKESLRQCAYLLLLDEDTHFPFGALLPAVAAAEHPLNRPFLDEKDRRVRRGYAMFAFPCAPSVEAASESVFARDRCGFGGVPAYHGPFGDFYGDLFGRGVFCGKGLADVRVYDALLRGRFPAERVLSHDIAEGFVLRVKTLTDTVLTDAFPRTEESYLRRAHRWIRGDVQNLIFVFGKNRLRKNGRTDRLAAYALLDNVRRALFPAAVLLGFLLSVFLPGRAGAVSAAVLVFCVAFPDLLRAAAALVSGFFRAAKGQSPGEAAGRAAFSLRRAFLSVCRVGAEGVNAADAVARALFRMLISKKKLLEWTTASAA
ncbi:MAG: hypothetical protein IJL26_07360, partial [Clostridia bacterium]|nr:hypothetical protein [Clostridia bacterium]